MKNILLVTAALCVLSVAGVAEEIDAVYFNPSRLGNYETLRITNKLTSTGSVTANSVRVAGTTTVTASGNSLGSSTAPVYKFTGVIDGKNGYINMSGAEFDITEGVTVNGGPSGVARAQFKKTGSGVFSDLGGVNPSPALGLEGNLYGGNLTVDQTDTVKISGVSHQLYGENPRIEGLRLGGNVIPVSSLQNCNSLQFYERITKGGNKVKVLGAACSGGSQYEISGTCTMTAQANPYEGGLYPVTQSGNACLATPPNAEDLANNGCSLLGTVVDSVPSPCGAGSPSVWTQGQWIRDGWGLKVQCNLWTCNRN